MKTHNKTIRLIATILFFNIIMACNTNTQDVKPRASGTPGELLMVVDGPDWLRESIAQRNWFGDDFPALPQSEKWFNAAIIPNQLFNGHFRMIRTILLFKHDENVGTASLSLLSNKWARNQTVALVVFPDTTALIGLMEQELPLLKKQIYQNDLVGIAKLQAQTMNNDLVQKIKTSHGIDITIPQGYRLKKDTIGFTWMEYETPKATFGIMVHSGTSTLPNLTTDFSEWRNANMARHVIGEREGSKMVTEEQMPLASQILNLNGISCTEIRGLWKMEGDFMGGPFVSVQIPNKNENIVVEGFVYAPGHNKKAVLVRSLDAILRSVKI
jgi:hypothetical protein